MDFPIIFMDAKENLQLKLRYASDILESVRPPIMNQEVEGAFEKIIAPLPEK